MNPKIIDYYTKIVWGTPREFFCDKKDETVFKLLTGQKTLTAIKRRLIRELSGDVIFFREVLPPKFLRLPKS